MHELVLNSNEEDNRQELVALIHKLHSLAEDQEIKLYLMISKLELTSEIKPNFAAMMTN